MSALLEPVRFKLHGIEDKWDVCAPISQIQGERELQARQAPAKGEKRLELHYPGFFLTSLALLGQPTAWFLGILCRALS